MLPCNNFLLAPESKSLQLYNKMCASSFEGLVEPSNLVNGRALSRRLLLRVSKEVRCHHLVNILLRLSRHGITH